MVCAIGSGYLVWAELPHHAVHLVLLNAHIEHHRPLRQPVLLVSKVERRDALGCAVLDDGVGAQRPNDVTVGQYVDLPDKSVYDLLFCCVKSSCITNNKLIGKND
jgi:hypothetical protein